VQPRFSPSFAASVITHVLVLLMFIVSYEFSSQMPVVENSDQDSKIISAFVVDSHAPAPIMKPIPKIIPKPVEVVQPPPPPPPPKEAAPKALDEQALQHEIDEEQQVIAIDVQRKKEAAQKDLFEKQILADIKKQAVKDKRSKQRALEKAMEREMKEQVAKSLQQQLMQEQQRVVGAKMRGEVNKYKALILQAIARQWLVPVGVDKTLSSELLIRVAPGGSVMDVQITRSSGDVSLDRSARDAVFKASPLPVPADEDSFEQFRQFVLKVKPQNLTSSDA
jgi:colicin import membrane protein